MTPLVYESKRYYFITKYGKEKGMSKYKQFLEKSTVKKTSVKRTKKTLTAGKTTRKSGFLFF